MFSETIGASCRSHEFVNKVQHIDKNGTTEPNSYTRYKILFYKKEFWGLTDRKGLNCIKILDLSGDVDQFYGEDKLEQTDVSQDSFNLNKMNSQNDSLSSQSNPIQNCFKKRDLEKGDETPKTETEDSNIWGKITGNLKSFLSSQNTENSNENEVVYLNVGPYVLKGKEVEFREGESFVIIRKVPNHCSCVCSQTDPSDHINHSPYYEICGVVNRKINFKDRPNFYKSSDETQSEEYYLQMSNWLNNDWFIVKVDDEILNNMLQENSYFKIVNSSDNKKKKAVLCILNNTYYIQRVELGGTILLLLPLSEISEDESEENLLVIVGLSKYVYNLIKCNPIFDYLPKVDNIHISSIFDQTPISDLEISDFILGNYELYPSYYLYKTKDTFQYMGKYFFGEFAVRIIQVIPIYYSNHQDKKKNVEDLTLGDLWTMINTYKDLFDFIPNEIFNTATLFQILIKVSDVEERFTTMDKYVETMKGDLIHDIKFKLNLFKIQKLVSLCLVSANRNREINYYLYTYYLDHILFNKAVPSYIFDEMIEYMANLKSENHQVLDYIKVLDFYYKNLNFNIVSNLFHDQSNKMLTENSTSTIFDKTGKDLFRMEDLEFKLSESHKLPCLNYQIFKLNTKGFTQLRFNYSMNSLLSVCRCPLSMHISYMSEKLVSLMEGNKCLIKIYPTVRHENLRDTLSELFRLKNTWHLEVLENKLRSFFKEKPGIDVLTGGPDYHGRLWITKEINSQNYKNENAVEVLKQETVDNWKKRKVDLKQIKEESYIIINWNVPV